MMCNEMILSVISDTSIDKSVFCQPLIVVNLLDSTFGIMFLRGKY